MPSEEQTTNQPNPTIVQPDAPVAPDVTVTPEAPATPEVSEAPATSSTPLIIITEEMKRSLISIMNEVASRIAEANNILIALSGDPSVDDLAAAIGFSLYLDRIGKRATAIYSGVTPNALEFLKPEDTFEPTADTLQDFVIALSKDKADHLRYKLDGDFVKIFITPYKKRIDEKDLEYSYGDYNVDLVIALNVNNGMDLDSALREYGRIMHDATVINVTTGNPGKFGEIEWSDKSASSVSEMIGKFLYREGNEVPPEKDEATALLTGIIAATDRFSKANTAPETMFIASKLMGSGADQQLISKNITSDINNQLSRIAANKKAAEAAEVTSQEIVTEDETVDADSSNPTELDIKHDDKKSAPATEHGDTFAENNIEVEELVPAIPIEPVPAEQPAENPDTALLADLKAAEASLAGAAAETTREIGNEPVRIENSATAEEKVLTPSADFLSEDEAPSKYSEMLESALAEANPAPSAPATQVAPTTAEPTVMLNPAQVAAPSAPSAPEINGVPEMNYNVAPTEELLPPPPAPPVDMSSPLPTAIPAPAPEAMPTPEAIPTPAPVATTPAAPADAASAFQIPTA